MAEADALEGGRLRDERRDGELVAAALLIAHQVTEDSEELLATILRQRKDYRAGEGASPMADDLSRAIDMLQQLTTRVSLLEHEKEDAAPGPRVKLFVTEVVAPIKDSVAEIKVAIKDTNSAMQQMAMESKELYEQHKSFLDSEQKRREKEMEGRTATGLVKKYLPIVTLVGAVIALFRVLGTAIEFYLAARSK